MALQKLIVVVDESISHRICFALAGLYDGNPFVEFRPMPKGAKDEDWLDGEFPDEPPHVILLKDSVLKPKGQTRAWLSGGLTVVMVDDRLGNILTEHLAAHLFKWWPTTFATVQGSPRRSAFVIPVRFTNRPRLPKWSRKPRRKPSLKRTKPIVESEKKKKARSRDKRQTSLNLPDPPTTGH
jgi:hypothetical protein